MRKWTLALRIVRSGRIHAAAVESAWFGASLPARPLPRVCNDHLFQDPAQFVGETVGIAGEHTSGDELAAGLSEVFGEPVEYQHVPAEVFPKLPFPGAELAANMFHFV